MTKCILKSVKSKNKLYKKLLNNPTSKNELAYKKYRNKLNHVIRISKKQYYEEQLIKYKQNTKMLWQTLNELLNNSRKTTKISKVFVETNSTNVLDDPHEIANKFNEYFTNVGPNLAKKINTKKTIMIYHDDISTKIIKHIAKDISKPLTHIFNLTFLHGVIPEDLKKALVTPIFKNSDETRFENYRPISVLTCFSKLLEKLMYNRLINFVEKNNLIKTPIRFQEKQINRACDD